MFLSSPLAPSATRVLFTGDSSAIDEIQTMLELLPICARGQVFIEVDDSSQIREVVSPGRVTVSWLDRSRRTGRPGTGDGCRPGMAVDRAVRAWLGEFFVDRDSLVTSEYVIWIGGAPGFAHDLRHDLRAVFAVPVAGATAISTDSATTVN